MWRRKKWAGVRSLYFAAAGLALFAAIFGGRTLWRAQAVLREAGERAAAESSLRFTARPIDPVSLIGLESVGAPAVYVDAQVFNGRLFIAGPAGLDEYDSSAISSGGMIARYSVGVELPPAPITALAVGLAGDSRAPELWIATAGEGLVAFDGRGFRQVRAEDPRFRKITSLLALTTGRILMGTEKSGVLVYDGRELKPFHPSLADVPVTALAGDDANLWIGTVDRGLLHWKAGALETISDALPDKQVLSLALGGKNNGETVYAGTGLGVAEIRDGKYTRTLAPGYFAQSLLAEEGKLWIGTLEEGMVSVPLAPRPPHGERRDGHRDGHRDEQSRSSACEGCSIHKIFRIDHDAGHSNDGYSDDGDVYALADDSLWRGGEAVIGAADSREFAVLADRNISALSMDGSGRLWIGYFDRGLQILTPGAGRGEHLEDDHLFCVNRIAQDAARGVSAVATANGLVMFDASSARRRVITRDDGLIANQITDVVLRPDGSAIAATPAGVSFIDASGISSIYAFQGLVNNHVFALASDGARTLAGTLGGLSILDGPTVKASFTTANSALKHNWITAIARVGDGWFIGTYGAGVLRMDASGRWEGFADLRGQIEINTNAMVATDRAVYAGTLDRGLAVYSLASGRWNFWTRGLPSNNVTAVEARGGIVYIGTDNGLIKVPESTVVNQGVTP
jgi:ligand-binding sensor domain-containing protein